VRLLEAAAPSIRPAGPAGCAARGNFRPPHDTPRRPGYTRRAMTWVDGVVLAVVLLSAGLAYFRGLVREVLGVGAWIGAIVLAIAMEPQTTPLIAPYVEQPWLATAIAVGAVFLAVLLVLKLLIAWLAGKVQRSALGGVDRALGLVFGAARGAFLVVVAYIVAGLVLPATDRWPEPVMQARSLPLVADAAAWLVGQLPEDVRPRLPEGTGHQDPSMDQLLRPPARSRSL
jgi:membrane protein required for colicin V production